MWLFITMMAVKWLYAAIFFQVCFVFHGVSIDFIEQFLVVVYGINLDAI